MSQYLNKDEVIAAFEWGDADVCEDFGGAYGCSEFGFSRAAIQKILDQIPAADVAPVVHAQWEHIGIVKKIGPIYPHCSACGIVSAAYRSQWEGLQGPWKYCPNCGAKMDGGKNGATD